MGAEDGEEIEVNDDEEVSDDMELETILRELDKKVEGKVDEKKDMEEAKKKVDEKKKFEEAKLKAEEGKTKTEEAKDMEEAKKEVEEAKKEVDEAVKVIKALKNELNEVNLLNAKLLYVNKIFKSKSLTESQKVKVINAFDRAESVKEVKNTYETLKESFNGTSQKSAIKESVGFASKTVLGGSTTSAPIVETDSFVARMQKLAGIITEAAFSSDGEPLMTHSQYRDYNEPSEDEDFDNSNDDFDMKNSFIKEMKKKLISQTTSSYIDIIVTTPVV
jgi:hypothetical protein